MPDDQDANLHPIPTDPDVFLLDGQEDQGQEREAEIFDSISFSYAQVGDILFVSNDHPLPDGWMPVDGKELVSAEWPEYVRAMRLTSETFVVPPAKTPDGYQLVIYLGGRDVQPR